MFQFSEVVPDGGHCGVIGAVGRLGYRQGLLELGLGTSEVPQVPQHAAEVATSGADGGVIGAKGGLADGYGPLE